MDDDVGQRRGRGAPRRPRGYRGGRGQGRQQRGGRFPGQREEPMEDDDVADNEAAEPVAPPREPPRRRVHIGQAALDRMLERQPEELLFHITNRVSINRVQHIVVKFWQFIMVALCNRADHYIFILFLSSFFFFLLLFFPRLISAVGNWMFTILWRMVWP